MNPKWHPSLFPLSGNTGLLSAGRKLFRLTRRIEVCLEFNQPVGIITKNAGILRDKDILQKMAAKNLVSVLMSVTSLMKICAGSWSPGTTTAMLKRLRVIKELSDVGVRTGVMLGL